jgi:ParB family chromosome partitioning protein
MKKLELSKVHPNPDQPRKTFVKSEIEELANSILAVGLMQPIVVRPKGDGTYEIIAGERRWRAHCRLHERGDLPEGKILAHVRKMDDLERDMQAIVENAQRVDVTPVEEAEAFQRLIDQGLTAAEIAQRIGRAEWRVRERLDLMKIAPEIRQLVKSGQLAQVYTLYLARLEQRDQPKVVRMISDGKLTSTAAVRAAVDAILSKSSQQDIFGEAAPRATESDVATITAMEKKIEAVASMVSAGWKDGECVVAKKVSPDRSEAMAERIKVIRKHLLDMENQLREASATAQTVMNMTSQAA